MPAPIAFLPVATLFNPTVPVYLDRETWAILDLVCAAGFVGFGARGSAKRPFSGG